MPQLGTEPFLHPGAVVRNCKLGAFVEMGEGTQLLESVLGDYSYTARYADIAYSDAGQVRERGGLHAAQSGRTSLSPRLAASLHVSLELLLAG